ncbi:MAG: flagellar motor protein MotB [Terracidiphilus sp.]
MNPRAHRNRVSHDRWLVSYADFITLLFAFFVVLYAFAKADQKKQAQVSVAIDGAFHSLSVFPGTAPSQDDADAWGTGPRPNLMNAVTSEEVLSPALVRDDLGHIRRELEQSLSSQIARHTISIQMSRDGLVISLREAGFFNSGSAIPRPGTFETLRKIGDSLGRSPYDVRIEGHTDNIPVHNSEFDSNWELSAARATRIARSFIELNSISPGRLSAAGYAEFHPVATNQTAEGRAENRRVDLVVLPRTQTNFAAPRPLNPTGPWRRITDGDSEQH